MSMINKVRNRLVVAALISAVIWMAAGRLIARQERPGEVRPPFAQSPSSPVLSGADVGVRLSGKSGKGTVSGTLVVRVNGQWMDVAPDTSVGVVPAGR